MVYALGGRAALDELEGEPFDVVVSDVRMPEIDGATVLGAVRDRHPQTVRIALSGQTELEAALRTVPVAHQFLSKPCDYEQLRRTIERVCLSLGMLEDKTLSRAAGGAGALPSVPALYTALVEASADPSIPMDRIGELVESDVAMYAKVLQLVNSSFFGLGRHVSTAREAIVYLGIDVLRSLVLSAGAFRSFTPAQAIPGFSVERLETHSMLVARVASAMMPDKRTAAEAFTAGMLHDIGKLVLAEYQPEVLTSLLASAGETGRTLDEVEEAGHHVSHAEIGGYLLTLWGLPFRIVESTTYHHAPQRLDDAFLDVSPAVYIANALVSAEEAKLTGAPVTPLSDDYIGRLCVADRLPLWAGFAAEQFAAAGGGAG
jgi:putative nucleotidyltransferase with HDIG domain